MRYKDKFYSRYFSTHTSLLYGGSKPDKTSFVAFSAYFGRFLPENKEVSILDAGCGNGEFVWWTQELGYKNAEGLDVSEEQIKIAEKAGIKNVKIGDIRILEKNYEVIFLRDVLEHFSKEEVLDLLESLYKNLSPSGELIIQTVNAKNWLWGRLRHGDFTHDLAFTEESISQVLLISGFNEVVILPQRPIVHGLISLIRYVLWRILEVIFSTFLLVETGGYRGIFTQNLIVRAKK